MRGLLALSIAVVLPACKSEKAPPPSVEPTGFSIRDSDLWLENPRDVCRSKKPEFLSDLLERVDNQSGFAANAEFRDFSVTDEDVEGNRQAILRVDIPPAGLFTVAGGIDPATCDIGPMKMKPGPNMLASDQPSRAIR